MANFSKVKLCKLFPLIFVFVFHQYASAQSPMQVAGTANKVAISSGDWSAPSTWGGSLPKNDDRILIPNGITVTVDGMISEEFKSIRIGDGAKLSFVTNNNTELRTEYLFSSMMGTLEIGQEGNQVNSEVKASLVFAERGGTSNTFDPNRFVPGAVLMGPTSMHGADKTSWLPLQVHPSAGDNQFILKSNPIGWQIGDKLVVAGTDPITNASINNTDEIGSDEVVTINSIQGNLVGFSPPLLRDHKAPVQASDLDVHVANLSRNIVISSENTNVNSISGEFRKPRGHIMFMHNLNVNLKYVEANNLGRTDKTLFLDDWDFEELERGQNTGSPVLDGGRNPRGRYSFHFHRGGLDASVFPAKPITPLPTPARVEGCVVNNDPGWGFVNHSSRVDFVRNVSYDVVGGAFNTESGNETGSFIENIAIRTINPQNPILKAPRPRDSYTDAEEATLALSDFKEGRQDFAFQGDGFWLHGTGVAVEGNVVAGCTGHAYVYWSDGLIEKGLGMARGDIDAHVPSNEFPVLNQALKDWKNTYPTFVLDIWYLKPRPFKNNTAYGFARGVQTYYVHTEFHQSSDDETTDPEIWFNVLPDIYRDQLDLVIDGTTLWNIGKVGFEHNHTANVTIKNSRILGYNCRTGFENYGVNPAPDFVSYEPEVIGLDLDFFHNTHRWNLYNNTIEGFAGNSVGVALPINAQVTLDGGTFNNSGIDILIGVTDRQIGDYFGQGMLSVDPTKSEIVIQGNINFQNPSNNIVLDPQLFYNEIDGKGFPLLGGERSDDKYFFAVQDMKLNFGPFDNATLYFDEQEGSYTPIVNENRCTFGPDRTCVSNQYVNKTNSQLKAQYNKSFAGSIVPNTAVTHPMIVGGKVSAVSEDPCDGAIPGNISFVTATNENCNSILINWSSANCADHYTIEKKIDSGNWNLLDVGVIGNSYVDANPEAAVLAYRVMAHNSIGNSQFKDSNNINCKEHSNQFTLVLTTNGNGQGNVSLLPAGGVYDEGTLVTITAAALGSSQFIQWTGDIVGNTNPVTIIMNSNKNIIAEFSEVNEPCEYSVFNLNGFESGYGVWNDGGSDCRRSINDNVYAATGDFCIRLRDNTNSSTLTTDNLDFQNVEKIKVAFTYYCRSMDNVNEDFWLQISTDGGANFTTIEEWNLNDEFVNNQFYTDEVTIEGIDFNDETQLRFRADASGNKDWVYLDDISISTCGEIQDDDNDDDDTSEDDLVELINFSFEEPGLGEYQDDYDQIPGWSKNGDGDSGVEKEWGDPTHGTWLSYNEAGDEFVYQELNHNIQASKTYTLKVDAKDLEDLGSIAMVLLQYENTKIVDLQEALTDDWQTFTLSFNSDDFPGSIGKKLKICFKNTGDEETYAGFDNFQLNIANHNFISDNTTLRPRVKNKDQVFNQNLKVFPNPVSGQRGLSIDFKGVGENRFYEIYDSKGKCLLKGKLRKENIIELLGLSVGIYYIRVWDDKVSEISKFIIIE